MHRHAVIASLLCVVATGSMAAETKPAPADLAADAQKGKAVVAENCAQCHAGRWEDETYESLTVRLKKIQSGETKHRFKVKKLNDEEIRQVAAYWGTNSRKSSAKPSQ